MLLAIQLIQRLSPTLKKIEALTDSPVFEACDIFLIGIEQQSQFKETSQIVYSDKMTLADSSQIKKFFPRAWTHLLDLIDIPAEEKDNNKTTILQLSIRIMESIFVRGKRKPIEFFERETLVKEEVAARQNEAISQNNIARTGGVHELFLGRILLPEKSEPLVDYLQNQAQNLQISLAQLCVDYLLIQKDWAGMGIAGEMATDSYIQETKTSARTILEKLRDDGWDSFVNSELALILNERLKVTQEMIDRPVSKATHDRNLIFDDSNPPKKVFNPVNLKDGKLNIPTLLFNQTGTKYRDPQNASEILQLSKYELYKKTLFSNSPKWHDIPNVTERLPQAQFALSLSNKIIEGSKDSKTFRGARGRVAHHVDITMRQDVGTISLYTSHNPEDGQIARLTADNLTKVLNITNSASPENDIKTNPYYPNSEKKTKDRTVEDILQLTDTELGYQIDRDNMIQDALDLYNSTYMTPIDMQIRNVFNSSESKTALNDLLSTNGYPQDNELVEQAFKKAQELLNPHLSRHTLLGLVLENDGATSNCVFPEQSYGRLSFSQFKDISKLLEKIFAEGYRPTNLDMDELNLGIRQSLENQTLARLGVNPLSYLAVYTGDARALAELVGATLSEEVLKKTMIIYQISELGRTKAQYFVSALSQTVESLFGAFGLVNNYLVARLNLTHSKSLNIVSPHIKDIPIVNPFFRIDLFKLPQKYQLKQDEKENYQKFLDKLISNLEKGTTIRDQILAVKPNTQEAKFFQFTVLNAAYLHYEMVLSNVRRLSEYISKQCQSMR
ncbi:MAG: hypothetical protein Fur0011_3000 [Candidatus Microgenomates bacterium]